MASYYTYGAVPTVEETVFGPLSSGYADGGEVDDLIPQAPPEDPMRGVSGPEMFRWSDGTYHFRPEESGQRTPIDQLPDYYRRLTEEALAKSPLESSPGPGLGGDEPVYTPRGENVPVSPLAAPTSSGAAPSNWLENMKQFTGGATPSPLAYLTTKGTGGAGLQEGTAQKTLSDLLKANKFEEAFKFAEANNLQQLLAVPAYLKDLRDPFTKEEAQQFLNAAPANFLPNLSGTGDLEKFTFDPRGAAERGAFGWMGFDEKGQPIASETGFPRLDAAWKVEELDPKESIFQKIFKAAALATAVAGGAQALGALGSAGGAGAAGAGTAGAGTTGGGFLGGLQSAGKALLSIPETIGIKVGEALGASVSSLQAKAIGNAVISSGITGAKGGDFEDVLKSAAMAAGLTYVSDAAIKAVSKGLQSAGVLDSAKDVGEALNSGVEAVGEGTVSNITRNVVGGLDQFTQTFTKGAGVIPSTASTLASVVGAQAATQPSRPTQGRDLTEAELETTPEGLRQVTVGAGKDFGAGLETGLYGGYRRAAYQPEEPVTEPVVEPKEEVKVTTEADKLKAEDLSSPLAVAGSVTTPPPPAAPVTEPPVAATVTTSPAELDVTSPLVQTIINRTPFEPAPVDPLTGLQEITATTAPEGLDVTDPLTQVLLNRYIDVKPPEPVTDNLEEFKIETERDLSPGILQYAPPIFTPVNPADILKDYQPTQVKSKLQELIAEYGTLENALKLLGALGAGAAKGPKMPTGGLPTGGGMGGALPKYTYARQQLSPDIDYYTYGTRPEARFFEQGLKLEQPTQPEPPQGPPSKPPVEEPVFATGGLTGYAKGGSKSSRYVDGPGSGRDDKIPALLSDGEYVIDAETLALLGDGSTKEGARRMDKFRANIRKHKGRALSRGRISPNAKSPSKYMGGGLT